MSQKTHFCFFNKPSFLITCFMLICSLPAFTQPFFDADFIPNSIGPGSTSTLTFTINNSNPVNPVTDMSFVNTLPAGVVVARPSQAVSECINGLLVAPEGGSDISFSEARISAGTSCTVRVNVTSSMIGTNTNISGDLTSSAGNSGTATADLTVAINRPGFSKSFSPNVVNFGDRSTLTFTIDNSLNTNFAFGTTFIDNLPLGMSIADPSGLISDCLLPTIVATPGTQLITFRDQGLLNAGATCTISVDVLAQARGRLNNTTNVLTSSPGGPSLPSGMAGDVLTVNSTGDIQLTQSFVDDPVVPGEPVALQFNLTSLNRNFDITDIGFTDDLDATLSGLVATGLPLNDVCGAGSQISGTSVLTLSGARLSPEANCSFTVMLQVPAGSASGIYPNTTSQPTGQITGQPTDGNPATDDLYINFAPQISKSFSPDSIQSGQTTSMDFTITNTSTTDQVTDITFNDNMSRFLSGVQVTNLPAFGFCGAGSGISTILLNAETQLSIFGANIPPGDSCNFSVELTIPPNTPPGTYTNTTEPVMATIAGQSITGHSASADLTVEDTPQLSMVFTNDPVSPGDTVDVRYRISSFEEGNLNASDISFSHDLDATLTGLVATGLPLNDVCGVGSQLNGTNVLTLTDGLISGGSACEFTVTLQVPAPSLNGTYPSTTSALTSVVNGQNISSNTASDNLQISSIEFSHSFVDDPSLPGDTVMLEYTIDNLSFTDPATGMFFTHNLSAILPGLTYVGGGLVDACGAGSSLTGTTFIIFVGGNLAPGSSCTFSIPLNIPLSAANNQYGSSTSVLNATLGATAVISPASSDLLTINNNLILFSKEFIDNPTMPGNTTSLEFTLVNSDSFDTATNLTFSDDLDNVLSGLSATGLPLNDICGVGSQITGTSLLTLTGGNLTAGGSCTFTVDVVVPVATLPGAYPNTTSDVTGTLNGLPIMGDPAIADLLVGFINFTKAFDGPVDTGNTAILTFNITNNDSMPLTALSFTDDLDAVLSGLTAIAPLPTNPCGAGSQLTGTSLLSFSGGQLAANSNCSFDVTVQIPAGLSDSTYMNVTSELSQTGQPLASPATATLQVNGVPFIDLSSTMIDFGGVEIGNMATIQTITVGNTGTGDLNINSISSAITPFSLEGSGSCLTAPFILAPGNNCTLDFGFTPTAAGIANQNIDLISDSGRGGTVTIGLTGNGLQAQLALSPNPLDFGMVEINTASTATDVTLTNNGTADLDVTAISAPSGDFSLIMNNCGTIPFSLAPTSSCTISYQFNPTATGPQSQNITFNSDSASTPDTLVLQGEGAQTTISLSNNQLNFPNTTINTTSNEELLTLNNTGIFDLRITTLSLANAPFILSGGSCTALPIVLAPNASCTLGYSFAPTATGDFNQTLTLTSNASSSPDTFDLIGSGIEPGLQLSDATLDFQSVDANTTSAPLSLNISNTGVADLIINSIDPPNLPFIRSGGSCGNLPLSLSTNQSCTLEYQFIPTTTGDFSQTVVIQSNASTSPDDFELVGSGIEPTLQFSSANLDFGVVDTNTTSNTLMMNISNTGPGELIINNLSQAVAPFIRSGGSCSNTPIVLSNNQSCTLAYEFMPTTSGDFNQTIDLQSNATSSPDSFDLVGSGIERVLIISDDTLNFPFTPADETQSQTLTLTSNGVDDVTISAISMPDAPFAVDFSDCGTLPITLAGGVSCNLIITYITEESASNSSFLITSNDPNSPLQIDLNGSGLTTPVNVPLMNPIGLIILLLVLVLTTYLNPKHYKRLDHNN